MGERGLIVRLVSLISVSRLSILKTLTLLVVAGLLWCLRNSLNFDIDL